MITSSQLNTRRVKAESAWNLTNEVVLVYAGDPIGIPGGADQTFPYKPHPQYRWLTNRRREGGVLAYDPKEGWTLFEPPVTEMELVWGGGEPAVGEPIEALARYLEARKGRPIVRMGEYPGPVPLDDELSEKLHIELDHARRSKDDYELAILRKSAQATAAGYRAITGFLAPGRTEREIQVEFEYAIARAGADGPGYASIVGVGPNSAVFHFTPGSRAIADGDLVLVDAGATIDAYVTDVTRSYPGNGRFTSEQQWLYDAVKLALINATAACTIGNEWIDVHATAARSLAGSLREAGLFRCDPDEALESGLIGLFLPHGIGHMVGLGVRDAGGPYPGRKGIRTVGGSPIRMDIPLAENYLVTVEPGLYFIPALLNNPNRRSAHSSRVNWDAIDPWIGKGGIRLEDNVLVTKNGPDVITSEIPK